MRVCKHIRISTLHCYLLQSEGQCVVALPQDLHNCSIHSLIHWPPNIIRKLRSQGLCSRSISQFSHSVVSDSLWLHGLQHARLPCPSPTPGDYVNSCPLHQWYHPTTSSSVDPFSFYLQSFPASGSFPLNRFFTSGGQSTGVSTSASVLLMNIQDLFPLGWTGWSPCSPRDSQESSPTPQFKSINSLVLSFLYSPTLISIHDYWKNHSFV